MIIVVSQLEVLTAKRKEFLQTVPVILSKSTYEPGCLSHTISRDLENEDRFLMIQAWASRSELDDYWCSDGFGTFMGTLHLLKNKPILEIHEVSSTSGTEAMEAVRSRVTSLETKQQQKTSPKE